MASGKSQIVPHILDLVPEMTLGNWYIPNKAQTVTAEKHDWRFALINDPGPDDKVAIHNMLDGCQYIESGLPCGDRLKAGITWQTAYRGFVTSVQRCINDGNTIPIANVSEQRTVIMFDQSKNVSLAKKPEQNSRRVDRVDPDVDVIFPFERIEDYNIHDYDQIPDSWRAMSVYGKYKNAITDYMMKKMFHEKPFKLDPERKQNVHLWRYGKIGSLVDDDTFEKSMEAELEPMGEYDFATLRYMTKVVGDAIRAGKSNLSTIVFRVLSTDTDLLLNCLYFLEFIKEKHALSNDTIPTIILISPWHSRRIIHVTNLFRVLKFKIEQDYGHGAYSTSVRSFVIALYGWGNDQMPSPFFIVGKCYMETFLTYKPLMGKPLVDTPRDSGHKYPHQCTINGDSYKMLYLLAYAHKHMTKKDKPDLWKHRRDGHVYHQELEVFIMDILVGGKKPLNDDKRPQGNDNIRARMIMTNYMLYSIEHGLRNIKGHKLPLSQIELHDMTHINLWDEYLARVDKDVHEKATSLGLINKRSCIYYSRTLKPNKKDNEIDRLLDYVNIVFKRFVFGQHVFNKNLLASCSTDTETFMEQYYEQFEMK